MPLQLVFWAINKHDVWLAGGGGWPKSPCWNITIYKIWHLRPETKFQTNILRGSKSYHRPSSATLGCIFYGWASPHHQEGSVSPQFVTLEQFVETNFAIGSNLSIWKNMYILKHCQRHNGPMGWHHNWRHLIASKFSKHKQMVPHAFVWNSATRWRYLH